MSTLMLQADWGPLPLPHPSRARLPRSRTASFCGPAWRAAGAATGSYDARSQASQRTVLPPLSSKMEYDAHVVLVLDVRSDWKARSRGTRRQQSGFHRGMLAATSRQSTTTGGGGQLWTLTQARTLCTYVLSSTSRCLRLRLCGTRV